MTMPWMRQSPLGPRRGRTLRAWFDAGWSKSPRSLGSAETSVVVDDTPGRRSPKAARVEAALLVADGPLSARRLVQYAKLLDPAEARTIVEELNAAYDESATAFRIEWVAAGYQLLTRARYAPWLQKLHERRSRVKLSPPALETVVVVAYRQPVTRAEVDAIRGVRSAEILRQLMERGLIRIVGEEDSLGRPYLYGTTKSFLEEFGLQKLDDLPRAEELRRCPETRGSVTDSDDDDESAESAEGDTVDAATETAA